MIDKKIISILEKNEFVMLASCRNDMQPNVAPKFLFKVEGNCIYLADYNIDRTRANIEGNPRVSLASLDNETFLGYQINGVVETVEEGEVYESLIGEFNAKKLELSTKRVIDGLHKERTHEQFEMIFADRVIIYKINVIETIKIDPTGNLERTKIRADEDIPAKKEEQ
jgi:uncharacterized pyridoxamine 5'-phosphate oxidase family protein